MLAASLALVGPRGSHLEWKRLPDLCAPEGLAGSFAGMAGRRVLVVGGSNFPLKKPWDGGTKVWYDAVYAWKPGDSGWSVVGRLPHPLAYGVSATNRDTVICAGGSDADRHYSEVLQVGWNSGRVDVTKLAPLPQPVANGCGALNGSTLYVIGGQTSPSALAGNRVFALDLAIKRGQWTECPPLPGPGRILAGCGVIGMSLFVFGGAELFTDGKGGVKRHYLNDAYRYDPKRGWRRLADMPIDLAASPSPVLSVGDDLVLLGGDDGSQVGVSHEKHTGFSPMELHYRPPTNSWVLSGTLPVRRATAPVVRMGSRWVLVGGERQPGIRSPEVWSIEWKR
ncbi:MAG: hypothetical protein P4L46_23050 [Fimbriimonas sp.]|nr:hypothetical protein [Fimbriimonas sp.]